MAANWTAFVAGDVLTAAQLNGVVDNFQDIAIFNETQASGTFGGAFSSGSWVKRTLNTTVVNNITSASLSSSVISLPAGTYSIFISTPAMQVNGWQCRLANTTDSLNYYGTSEFSNSSGNYVTNRSFLNTVLTIAGTKNFEVQQRCGTSTAQNWGLGYATSLGGSEVYSVIQITRIA
jgi:hypothetical protein